MRRSRSQLFLAAFAALLLSGCSGAEKFPVRTYQMGERVTLGPFIYSAFETQWLTHIGEESSSRIPKHRFFLVRTSIVNSTSKEILAPNLSLVDERGQSYPELSDGEGVPQWIGYLRQLKPSDSAQGNLVFDAPPSHYKLRVTDDTGERVALIDIPLSFNAESPGVTAPAELKKQ
jgi:hypothetical protein